LARVLKLQRLLQALFVGRLDADEHPFEVRAAKESEQLIVLSDVQRGFGAEVEPIIVALLVVVEESQQVLGERLVADQVVVNEEDAVHVHLAKPVELALDLLESLGARLAAEHDDDVAKLAAKRA